LCVEEEEEEEESERKKGQKLFLIKRRGEFFWDQGTVLIQQATSI
jgi:hypothetical protein